MVRALVQANQLAQAEATAQSITAPYYQAQALAQVARAPAKASEHERAKAVAEQAETIASSITEPDAQAHARETLVEALVEANQLAQAEALATQSLPRGCRHMG